MDSRKYVLGIDTSNYKSSIALTDKDGRVILDERRYLKVKQGERGLRQSDALFQHVKNLPDLFEGVSFEGRIAAVAYSSKPRPEEGSYMPCFLAGESFARSFAAIEGIPCLAFSHQEGHIEAVKHHSPIRDRRIFLSCHFSGGTTEVLKTREKAGGGYDIDICAGTRDIAFGQVIDRAGVALGLGFPAGEAMDELAMECSPSQVLTPVKVKDGWINLSGMDTQIKRYIEDNGLEGALAGDCTERREKAGALVSEIFAKLSAAVAKMTEQAAAAEDIEDIMMAGGFSSSRFMRSYIEKRRSSVRTVFGEGSLSRDNAVGISLLGGGTIWG